LGRIKSNAATSVAPAPEAIACVRLKRQEANQNPGFASRPFVLCGLPIKSAQRASFKLPPQSRNLNPFAERWVRSVKEECLSKLIMFGESSLRHALTEFVAHYHSERNHLGKGNLLLFPSPVSKTPRRGVRCRERLGGLLRYYCRAA
jgi:hypothetical protein